MCLYILYSLAATNNAAWCCWGNGWSLLGSTQTTTENIKKKIRRKYKGTAKSRLKNHSLERPSRWRTETAKQYKLQSGRCIEPCDSEPIDGAGGKLSQRDMTRSTSIMSINTTAKTEVTSEQELQQRVHFAAINFPSKVRNRHWEMEEV